MTPINIKFVMSIDLLAGFLKWDNKKIKIKTYLKYFWNHIWGIEKYKYPILDQPVHAHILLTNRCSMVCEDCCFVDIINKKNTGPTDLTLENVTNISNEGIFSAVGRVILFGGEPLLCKDHLQIIRFFRSKGIVVQLTTNGLHSDKEAVLEALASTGLNMLNISIYDTSERGKKFNLKKIEKTFMLAKAGAFPLNRIGLLYHSTKVEDYERAYEFALKVGAQHLLFNTTFFSEINKAAKSIEIDDQQFLEGYINLCEKIKSDGFLQLYFPEKDEQNATRCPFIETSITIGPQETLSICCLVSPKPFYGTVKKPLPFLRAKKAFHEGNVPGFCEKCPVLGTKYV